MNLKTVFYRRFYKHPRILLVSILAVTLFFALQLPRIRFDNNNFRFIPESDAARLADEELAKIFGDEVPLLIGIQRQYASVIDNTFLSNLRILDEQLAALPLVKKVVSLTTTLHIDSNEDSMVTEKLIPDNLNGTPQELDSITEKIRSWELYNRNLVSDDLKATQIIIFLDIKKEESGLPLTIETCREVMRIADAWHCPDSKTFVTGAPIFSEIVNEATNHDLFFLIPIVIAVVLCVLFLSFRRFTGVFLPLLTVMISCIWALGAMALFQVPLSILSTVLPVILIAVGSAYGIHVVNHYFDGVIQSAAISRIDHAEQIIVAMANVLPPVFLAALTTFAGFVSFCFTSVVPIFEFGIFASFGVLAAFIVAVTLIPTVLIIRGPKNPVIRRSGITDKNSTLQSEKTGGSKIDAYITDTLMIIHAHRRSVLLVSMACVIFSFFGISKLEIDNILMEYFDPDVQIVKSDTFIQKEFGGSKVLNLLIATKDGSSILRPDILQAIDSLAAYTAAAIPEVGKITSVTDLIKRLNQVYNADAPANGLPPQREQRAENDARTSGSVHTNFQTTNNIVSYTANTSGQSDSVDDFNRSIDAVASPIESIESIDSIDSIDDFEDFGSFGEFDEQESSAGLNAEGIDMDRIASLSGNTYVADAARRLESAHTSYDFQQLLAQLHRSDMLRTGKNITAAELLAAIKKAYNYRGAAYYEIPSDPLKYGKKTAEELSAVIQSYLILVAGNTQGLIDDVYNPKALKVNIQLRTRGQQDSEYALQKIMGYVQEKFPKDVQVKPSGTVLIEQSLNKLVVQSQLISLGVSLGMVFIILAVFYRSIAAGIIGTIPLLISIALNFGVMGVAGIKLNIGTAMVASFAIGIGIDYTIHYLAAYHREYAAGGTRDDFLLRTFHGSGKAILFNAVSVGAGFAVLMLSKFNMLSDLGLLIALIMGTSSFASLTILPTLLDIIKPHFIMHSTYR
ncbi:MAG: efflux RND transporter permease subunit [Treponema sp.]